MVKYIIRFLCALGSLGLGVAAWYVSGEIYAKRLRSEGDGGGSLAGKVEFWRLIPGPVIGIVVALLGTYISVLVVEGMRKKWAAESRRRREHAEAQEAERQHLLWVQQALRQRLLSLIEDCAAIEARLPVLAKAAARAEKMAEHEFDEGAFAPFWDAIEDAVGNAAKFQLNLLRLTEQSKAYRAEAPNLDSSPPKLIVRTERIPTIAETAMKLRLLVRRAQKDFHFSTIYEQRKTNRVLVEGFSTLGQAISDLEERLESSLGSFASEVTAVMESESRDRREHETQELEMLDNIQRRKVPRR